MEFDQDEFDQLEAKLAKHIEENPDYIDDYPVDKESSTPKNINKPTPHFTRFGFEIDQSKPKTTSALKHFCNTLDSHGNLLFIPSGEKVRRFVARMINFNQTETKRLRVMEIIAFMMISFDSVYEGYWDVILSHRAGLMFTVHFPSLDIQDSEGNKHIILDLYGMIEIRTKYNNDGQFILKSEIRYTRSKLTPEEVSSDYMFSHGYATEVIESNNTARTGRVCAGSGEITTIMGELNSSIFAQDMTFTLDKATLITLLLEEFFSYEHIGGNPPSRISNIGINGRYKPQEFGQIDFTLEFIGKIGKSGIPGVVVRNSYYGNYLYLPYINSDLIDVLMSIDLVPKCYVDIKSNTYFITSGDSVNNNSYAHRILGKTMIIFRDNRIKLVMTESSMDKPKLIQTIHPTILNEVLLRINKLLFIHSIKKAYDNSSKRSKAKAVARKGRKKNNSRRRARQRARDRQQSSSTSEGSGRRRATAGETVSGTQFINASSDTSVAQDSPDIHPTTSSIIFTTGTSH